MEKILPFRKDQLLNNITGIWHNPVTGYIWSFKILYSDIDGSTLSIRQTKTAAPIDFKYTIVENNNEQLLKIDDQLFTIKTITSELFIFQVNEGETITLHKGYPKVETLEDL